MKPTVRRTRPTFGQDRMTPAQLRAEAIGAVGAKRLPPGPVGAGVGSLIGETHPGQEEFRIIHRLLAKHGTNPGLGL